VLESSDANIAIPNKQRRKRRSVKLVSEPYQLPDIWIRVVNHRVLEGFQEVLLELEMRQLFLLQETHGELSEGIQCEESNMRVIVTANLVAIPVISRP